MSNTKTVDVLEQELVDLYTARMDAIGAIEVQYTNLMSAKRAEIGAKRRAAIAEDIAARCTKVSEEPKS